MDFKLKKACKDCPFRKDVNMHLRPERARQIAEDVATGNKTFTCHKTINNDARFDDGNDTGHSSRQEQHCVGALMFVEQGNHANSMVQIAERLGLYKPEEVQRDVAVFSTPDEMAKHYS